jgi:uncharacterized repeat protein (TIGR01451 family)
MLMGLTSVSQSAFAAGTLAGTDIENIATATYTTASGPVSIDSNKVIIKVDELLDVVIANTNPGDVTTTPGAPENVLTYKITNTGNGSEAYRLVADVAKPSDDFDPNLTQIYIDNGNGVYDPGVDVVYIPGTNDPVLAPDASVTVFVLTSTPATVIDGNKGDVGLKATAVTGSGAPGTTFAGAGTGGSDAVVGTTTASQEALGRLVVQSAMVTLVKTATIVDPLGGSNPIPGAIITYKLVANVTGSGSLANVNIADAIPAGTTYQTQTITYETVPQTDASDADAGNFNGSQINVAAGSVPAGQSRTVTFKVKIQ